MTATETATVEWMLPGIDTKVRLGGAWLAAGSLLFVVGLLFHPPPSPDPAAFMATIAGDPTRWVTAHAVTAVSLFAVTIAGLVVLTAGSRLTQNWWTTSAWAVLVVGSLWVTTAALAEATVVTAFAVDGDLAAFETWQLFAEANALAFVVLAAAVAVIAGHEARGDVDTTPAWAAWLGSAAAAVAAAAYLLGVGLGVELAGPVWLVTTIVMSLWTLWFGAALSRSTDVAWTPAEESGPGRQEAV